MKEKTGREDFFSSVQLTMLVVDDMMLYRPLLLLLPFLHSAFNVKYLTMNSWPMHREAMVYILFLFSLSFYVECICFYSLVHRSDGYLRGKEKEYRSHFIYPCFYLQMW